MLYALGKETSFPPFADDRDLHISVLPQAAAALFWRRLAFVAPVLRVAAPRHGLGANLPRIASGRIPRRLRRRMLTSASRRLAHRCTRTAHRLFSEYPASWGGDLLFIFKFVIFIYAIVARLPWHCCRPCAARLCPGFCPSYCRSAREPTADSQQGLNQT